MSFYVADMNASVAPDGPLGHLRVVRGRGDERPAAGHARVHGGLTDGFSGFVSVDFSAVTLVDGQVYTAVLTNDTARWGRVACGNQYAGGTALYADAPSPTADALFRIGWQPAPSVLVVEVDNVPPAFEAGPDEALAAGAGAFSRTIAFTDPGVLDVHTVTVDYGDGSPVADDRRAAGRPANSTWRTPTRTRAISP